MSNLALLQTIVTDIDDYYHQQMTKMHNLSGGQTRARKGSMGEELLDKLIRGAWLMQGHHSKRLRIDKKPIMTRNGSVALDKHVWVDDQLCAAVESKAYADTSMMKRTAMEMRSIALVHKKASFHVFQLEDGRPIEPNALSWLKNFVPIEFHTFLRGRRNSHQPIHQKIFAKTPHVEDIVEILVNLKGVFARVA